MTATEMIPAVGAEVMVRFESILVRCRVKDVKYSWGKPRLLVCPKDGTGEQWVEMQRLEEERRTTALVRR